MILPSDKAVFPIGSDTRFTNLWSLLRYIQSLLHYIENAQENKKNTILTYNIAENSKRIKRNEEKVQENDIFCFSNEALE
jgi:hypothetical protein